LCAAFFYLHYRFVLFWHKSIGAKATLKYFDEIDNIISRLKHNYVISLITGGFGHLKREVDNLKMTYLEMSMNQELGPCKGIVLKQFEDERVILISFKWLYIQSNSGNFNDM
jgi:hypothetical protein